MSVQPNAKVTLPYRSFKFRIYFEGKSEPVALMSKVTALKRTTEVVERTIEVVEWREGGESNTVRKLAGKTKYEPVTLERGLSVDTDFEEWADQVNKHGGTDLAQKDNEIRKELRVEVSDRNGDVVMKYKMHKCWVSEYAANPNIDANANAVAIKMLKLEIEGWEKDR